MFSESFILPLNKGPARPYSKSPAIASKENISGVVLPGTWLKNINATARSG